ncbi:TauD/TfdA family dioxygenase [Hydrogenophaga sp. NH-16]|uniref:TauD/TfdA dioxygenase family protein n=1 Tax=Hydrogenophaga sp. NH-16 TaxID=2184519 RepID=UPI001F4E4962|nr:TauD/TfdA family dioxygenase [Hydrogenophaga sp. NH-16]
MSAPALTVTRLAGALGAEISGLDLSRSLRQDDLAALRSAWLAHGVIFFRDQPLTPGQFLAPSPRPLARRWNTHLSAASRAFRSSSK